MMIKQAASSLLLIRPSEFDHNSETSSSNTFQQKTTIPGIRESALQEFETVVEFLRRENIDIIIADDIPGAGTPDAVFPNNWVSFHADNRVVLYPMLALNRRKERRIDIIEKVAEKKGLSNVEYIDLTYFEKSNQFLEGTGSIVFDHQNKIAYAGLSPRTHKAPFEKLLSEINYSGFHFNSQDPNGDAIYHTNVLMSIGSGFAIICEQVIHPVANRRTLLEKLEMTGHQLIIINPDQMASFAGNVLEVESTKGEPVILLSESARKAFTSTQIRQLEQFAGLLPVPIPVIEKTGGGSIRCMVAEIFLNGKADDIVIKSPAPEEMEAVFNLRWQVLRAPWNQPQGSERDDQENNSMHFIASRGKKIIATARLQELQPGTAQLRYMAVDPAYHGKGIGSKMLSYMEKTASEKGFRNIFLQSRENAVDFYKSNGYRLIEKTYMLFGEIQHYSMEKNLR